MNQKNQEWEDKFYEFGNETYWDWDGVPDKLVDYVRNLLSQEKEKATIELVRRVTKQGEESYKAGKSEAKKEILGMIEQKADEYFLANQHNHNGKIVWDFYLIIKENLC